MRYLFPLFFCCFLADLQAQTPSFIHYTSGQKINDMALDGQYVWAATNGGMVRYDKQSGQSTFYNRANSALPINEIFSVAIGADGTRWLGTRIGLVRWQGDICTVLNPLDASGYPAQLWMNRVRVDANGLVWISFPGHFANLLSYDGQDWKVYDDDLLFGGSSDFETNLQIPGIWVNGGWDSKTFYFFDGSIPVEYSLPSALYDSPGQAAGIDSWHLDANGKVWLNSGNRLLIPNGNTWDVEPVDFWPDAIVPAIDGSVWACNDYHGVYKRSPAGAWEQVFDTYLPFNSSNSKMLSDNNGDLWLGTEKDGLQRFHEGAFAAIRSSVADIPGHAVVQLEVTGAQNVWAIFEDGFVMDWLNGQSLARFEQNEWKTMDYISPNQPIWGCKNMTKDGLDRLWLAAFYKLFRYDGQWEEIPIPAAFTFGQIYSVNAEPTTNNVWIGGYGKFARYNGTDFQVFDAPTPTFSVEKLTVDQQGNVWIPYASNNNEDALGRFDGMDWTIFTTTTMKLSLYSNYVRQIKVAPNGEVWVITPYEITHFDGTDWHKFPLNAISLGGEFSTIAFDGLDKIWIGSYLQNCFTVNPNLNLIKIENDTIQLYPYKTTPLPYPNITALSVDGNHNLWIGAESGGIAVFNENGVTLGTGAATPFKGYRLMSAKAFPNPSSRVSWVEYTLETGSDVRLELCSMSGQVLQTSSLMKQIPGTYQWELPIGNLPQGAYCWRIWSEDAIAAGLLGVSRP